MKLHTSTQQVAETCLESDDLIITVTQWSNVEGCNILCTGDHGAVRLAAAFRWEEVDMLIAALAASRSTP